MTDAPTPDTSQEAVEETANALEFYRRMWRRGAQDRVSELGGKAMLKAAAAARALAAEKQDQAAEITRLRALLARARGVCADLVEPCNRVEHGQCSSRKCLVEGGFVPGSFVPGSGVVLYELATCTSYRAATLLTDIEAELGGGDE